MRCIECNGGPLLHQVADVPAQVKGEKVLVATKALVCPDCGYATIDGANMAEYMRLAADTYRRKHSLLTSSEIRTRRNALRMSQEQFASYLGTGTASIKRWELGKIQDQAMDRLIRMMTDSEAAKNNYIKVSALTAPIELVTFWQPPVEFVVGAARTETKWWPSSPDRYVIDVANWEKELSAA